MERAGELLRSLDREPAYARHVAARGRRQFVVLGYSDSNKQAGIAGSRWAMQVAQNQLLEASRDTGLEVAIFHGRGGTPARGGGRTEYLVESAPAGAIHGLLRLTEQGEVVNHSYGLRPIAMRTLERTFAAVALASAGTAAPAQLPPTYRAAMGTLAAGSVAAYRGAIYGDPGFLRICAPPRRSM